MSKNEHILIISSWFPTEEKPFLGNFVEFQANLLSKQYKVSFLRLLSQYQKPHKKRGNQSFDYIDIFYKKYQNPVFTYFSKKKALKKALKNSTATFVHGHVSFPDGWLFRIAKAELQIPLVVTEHGSYYAQKTQWNRRMNVSIPKTLKAADHVIAVSSFLAADMQVRFPKLDIKVIGNHLKKITVDNKKKPAELTFLHVSTLSKIKNVAPIFHAFAEFIKTHPTARLTIVSDENPIYFQQLSKQLNLVNNCSFHGPVEHEAISHFYQQAHCLIMNSSYESFSIVMAEAWQTGIPIISTPVGIAHNMNPACGILTDGSETSILTAMNTFSETQSNFNTEVIQQQAEMYSEQEILNQLSTIYDSFTSQYCDMAPKNRSNFESF